MRFRLIAAVCLCWTCFAVAQQNTQAQVASKKLAQGGIPDASDHVARSRKVWENFRSHNKTALAATLADGFQALEEGGSGFFGAKEYLSTLDDFDLKSYNLTDYMVTPLAAGAVLIHYHAVYEGVSGGATTKGNAGFSEIWVRQKNDGNWKIQYLQETYIQ
jgi:hypothetical protein